MKKRVLIVQPISKPGIAYLEEKGYELVYPQKEDRDEIIKLIKTCQGAISKTYMLDKEILACAPVLQVIGKHGAGVDNVVNVTDATALGICVCNTPLANCRSVAEHTMGLILALSKNLRYMDRAVREGDFYISDRMSAETLEGKTLGIIGIGNIGSIVAAMAHFGFNMNILAYDPVATQKEDYITRAENIDDLLQISDYISLHLPALPETIHMIGERQLNMMKPSAFLINCARGQLVDEAALLEALREQKIAGAALDVYEAEPPKSENPLFSLSNIILTPHSAALSNAAMDAMSLGAAMGVHEVLTGKTPTFCVNWNEVRERRM